MKSIYIRYTLMLCFCLVLSLSVSQTSLAQMNNNFPMSSQQNNQNKPNKQNRGQQMIQELNLTQEQKEQIKALHQTHMNEQKAMTQSMKQTRQEFDAVINNPEATDEDLKNAHKKFQVTKEKMEEQRFNHIMSVRKLLTKEQKMKFKGFDAKPNKQNGQQLRPNQKQGRQGFQQGMKPQQRPNKSGQQFFQGQPRGQAWPPLEEENNY